MDSIVFPDIPTSIRRPGAYIGVYGPWTGAPATRSTSGGGCSLSIAATDADKFEGDDGATDFTFTVTRTGPTTSDVSVDWAVSGSGGNPATGADFVGGAFPAGTLTIPAGQTSGVIAVQVQGDTDVEPDQGFTVTLSNPTYQP